MRREIADLFESDGPFATAYLDAHSNEPQAAQHLQLRWKTMRRELEEQGADEATLAAMDPAAVDGHAAGDTLALVAAGGQLLLRRMLPEPPTADRCRWGSLPWVGPLIETDQTLLPHLVVLADRTGADLYGFSATGHAVEEEVQGTNEEDEVRRSAPGGWSQRRYQQRAVNAWESNAKEVADEVAAVAERLGARLIAVGGDVHAVRLLCDALPERLSPVVRVLESASRAVDGGVDHVAAEVSRLVDTVVSEETVELLREFKEERGQHDRAAEGPARVMEALQTATVRTLLVHDDPDDDRRAWFGPEGPHISPDPSVLQSMGVSEPRQGRLVDACIRAAARTGADVRVVPAATVADGLGAILRHTGASP